MSGSQVKTLSLQTSYDSKLNNATYDALKAFQLNTLDSSTSDLSNSKIRDIEASVNSFFYSIANNFNMAGYNQDVLKEYVPALVYTMYDGYYIYSPYTNTLSESDNNNESSTYKNGEKISGLKPYIYYSCRYKRGNDDFVITYSLDNYITIQGIINDEPVFDYGYLISNCSKVRDRDDCALYRGITIEQENLREKIGNTDYTYIKINGVKYYKENNSSEWFSYLNGQKYKQQNFNEKSKAAVKYYSDAADFRDRMKRYRLNELKTSNAVDEEGKKINTEIFGDYNIFDFDNQIEEPNSNFNQHRLAVIRYSIEKNLSTAIANYNNYSGVSANFQMPKLKEDEWDKIINHISIISFLQGLNIGGKVYNGYSIITNTKNEEVVAEDSIYIVSDGNYHRATDRDLLGKNNLLGVFNVDFERRSLTSTEGTNYFFPRTELGCYLSIVNQTNVEVTDNIYKYMMNNKDNGNLAKAYFTALGRERYSMYKINNNSEELIKQFLK